jgi:hypothetical protein
MSITHLVWTYMWIIWEYQGCVGAMNSLEKYKLLPVLAAFHQALVLAARLVVYTRLGLAHNRVIESWVQYPASCSRADGSLQRENVISIWQHIGVDQLPNKQKATARNVLVACHSDSGLFSPHGSLAATGAACNRALH